MSKKFSQVKSILRKSSSPESKLEEMINLLFSEVSKEERDQLVLLSKSSLLQSSPTSSFLERMSHEIRTPLHSILGFLELLREALIDTAKREYVNEAYKSAEVLHSTIDDILFYSRIESGQIIIRETDFNLSTLVDDLIDEFLPITVQNKLEIVSYMPASLYRNFYADYEKIRKILFNLIENCIEYSNTGYISLEFGLLSETSDAVDLEIDVISTGLEYDNKSLSSLFESFTYLGNSANGSSSSGLSLVISKKLTEILQGTLMIQKNEEKGFRFKLNLKVNKSRIESEILVNPKLNGYETLILSYSFAQRMRLNRYYKDMHSKVETFSNEVDLLSYLKEAKADKSKYIIISDIISFHSPNIGISQNCIEYIQKHNLMTIFLRPLGISFPSNYPIADAIYLHQPLKLTEIISSTHKLLNNSYSIRSTEDAITFVPEEVKILICEDNAINHKLLENYLKGTYQNVDFARNGREGILKAEKNKYDIILMDCEMPIMDGYEATRHIRNSYGLNAGVPIIALTAHVTKEDREKCFACGMIEFISKPFRKEGVLKTIQKYLSY